MNRPLKSFGSNHVDLGGMILLLSAISINSLTVVGYMEKARHISLVARLSSSFSHLIPPTKSILLSVLGSSMPRIGDIRLF